MNSNIITSIDSDLNVSFDIAQSVYGIENSDVYIRIEHFAHELFEVTVPLKNNKWTIAPYDKETTLPAEVSLEVTSEGDAWTATLTISGDGIIVHQETIEGSLNEHRDIVGEMLDMEMELAEFE